MSDNLVHYKINRITQPGYKLHSKAEGFAIPPDDCEITLTLGVAILPDQKEINIKITAKYIDKRDKQELLDFNMDAFFGVLESDKMFTADENNIIQIPDNLLLEAMSISIGGARGMLVLLNKDTYLSQTYLPIYNTVNLLNNLKAKLLQVPTNA